MEWIKCSERLPDPFDVVWIYWRDREVLLGCRTYIGKEKTECDPTEGWYSFADEKVRYTNWWMPVTIINLDPPKPPEES